MEVGDPPCAPEPPLCSLRKSGDSPTEGPLEPVSTSSLPLLTSACVFTKNKFMRYYSSKIFAKNEHVNIFRMFQSVTT